MNKINTKSIVFSLAIMAFLAFGVAMTPAQSYAVTCGEGGCNTVFNNYSNSSTIPENNPKPVINSISPNSSNIGTGTKTITITGDGFVSGSIARVNGSNRPTTFIDRTHLLTQITGNDTLKYASNGGFFITVFSGGPGGGNSNGIFFTINKPVTTSSSTSRNTNSVNDTSTNFMDTEFPGDNGDVMGASDNRSDLASSAIFGGGTYSFGLIQWIFSAILVLFIIILARKVFGAHQKYHATPLKHD